ncbi:MAG: DsbA family oxidoreductase [Hyphomicrobiales bacterium]
MPLTVRLDIVSDVMCPWCYIGKRRLEAAMALVPELKFDIRWRPFQLDPTIPADGMDRQEYLTRKFGRTRAKEFYENIRQAGASEGIEFDFAAIEKSPNTVDAHRLIRWAAGAGCQDACVEMLFERYFIRGQDIGDKSVLVSVAGDCGMDADLVGELLDGTKDVDLVSREFALAQAMGIQGVPGFIFENNYLVSGAQAPESLADAAQRAANAPAEEGRPGPFDSRE